MEYTIENPAIELIITDHDVVKSMIGNLTCCSSEIASGVRTAIDARLFAQNKGIPIGKVPASVLVQILGRLPEATDTAKDIYGEVRYRAGNVALEECCELLDQSVKKCIQDVQESVQ